MSKVVKFATGSLASYHGEDGLIYFDTTNKVIRFGNNVYGVSTSDLNKLAASFKAVSLNSDLKTLTFTKNDDSTVTVELLTVTTSLPGLMSAADKTALDTLAGTGAGSLAKAQSDLNTAINAVAEDLAEATVTAADKSVIVTAGSTEDGTTTGTTVKVNVKSGDNALKLDENGLYVDLAALTSYEGENAISVTGDDTKTIALTIANSDNILSQNTAGLLANLSLSWNKTDGLKLIGKNDTVISTIPSGDFIKDGMLDAASLVVDPDGQEGGTYIKFTFNTDSGKEDIFVNVTTLIDIYTGSNGIKVVSNDFQIDLHGDTESYLSIADGKLKLDGVNTAISTAAAAAKTVVEAGDASLISVTSDTTATDGHVKYTVNNVGLATAASVTTLSGRVSTNEGNITGLDERLATLEETVESIEGSEATITSVKVNGKTSTTTNHVAEVTIDGADVKLTGYDSSAVDSTNGVTIAATDTVNTAIAKLDVLASINAANDNTLANRVTSVTGLSGNTYTANAATNYISGATSLNNADTLLDAQIKAAMDALTWDERD